MSKSRRWHDDDGGGDEVVGAEETMYRNDCDCDWDW
jgi:hypothetical protein